MNKRAAILTITAGLLISAVVAGGLFYKKETFPERATIIAQSLPTHIRIEGEALVDGALTPFVLNEDNNNERSLSAPKPPEEITLRLIDTQDNAFYDLTVTDKISLAGFEPNTPVTLETQSATLYQNVPMDWNGRITLPIPVTRPLWLSFSQNDEQYRIGIMTAAGGAV